MLIANLSKHPSMQHILTLELPARRSLDPPTATLVIDQLLSVFLLGENGRYNPDCSYDYLAYAFAELAKFCKAQTYFTTPKDDDAGLIPLTKVAVFTEHGVLVRRAGAANTIKNVCFGISEHHRLLNPKLEENRILPYILLPLMGTEEYPDEETEAMPDELQLLPPDKVRETDVGILKTHLDTLLLLSTTKEGREALREVSVYPIVRECHLAVEDEGVREACDRVVQVLMRDEAVTEDDEEKQDSLLPKADGDYELTEV